MSLEDTSAIRPQNADHCNYEILSSAPGDLSRYLSLEDVQNIVNASAFSVHHGIGHLVLVTIRWDHSARFVLRDWMDHQGDLFEKMRRWLMRKRVPVSFIWAREMGSRNGPHTHLLLHLPVDHWGEFKAFMLEAGEFGPPDPSGEAIKLEGGKFGTKSPRMRAGTVIYLLKSADPKATARAPAAEGGTMPLMRALGIRDEQCLPLAGKRQGTSQSLTPTSRRNCGWRELRTVAELRRYLHPVRGVPA